MDDYTDRELAFVQPRLMQTYLADTFQAALAKLDNQSQKAAKLTAFDMQSDPAGHGKRFHRIGNSREKTSGPCGRAATSASSSTRRPTA